MTTAQALLIEVRWPDGRFHGVREPRRGERDAMVPEWPPSPFRLFQALVAGAYGGRWASEAAEDKDTAFEWLEGQAAPTILAPPAERLRPLTYFVPNNDLDTRDGDPARVGEIRAPKTVRTSTFDPEQPVAYLWRFDGEDGSAHRLAELAQRLHTLGHGVDAAFAHAEVLTEEAAQARLDGFAGLRLSPAPGPPLSGEAATPCPAPGSLDSLRRRHLGFTQRFEQIGTGRRAVALFRQPPKAHARAVVYARPPQRRLFELRPAQGAGAFAPWPLEDAYGLAVAVREHLARRLGGAADARTERFVTGRTAGPADAARRVRILPLPTIGFVHADPRIRRVLVELPPDCPISRAELDWALAGQELADPATGEVHDRLLVPATDTAMLRHYGVDAAPANAWQTVTPMALPEAAARRRIDPQRLAADVMDEAKRGKERAAEEGRAASAILQALRHAGVTIAVTDLRVQREPFRRRLARAEAFAVPDRFRKERLWHAEITFAEPVAGPLALGDGRFCGLGLMAPPERRPPAQDLFGFAVTSDRAMPRADRPALLQAVRRALMSRARDAHALPLFSGHTPDGAPARSGQHRHAYLTLTGEDDTPVVWVVAPWRVDRSWRPMASERRDFLRVVEGLSMVRAGRLGLLQLRRLHEGPDPLCGPVTTWASATPYRPDRYARSRKDAVIAAIADLERACLRLGLPRPRVDLVEAAGGGTVSARLHFPRRVAGPLLLGRDAHLGGGQFRPVV